MRKAEERVGILALMFTMVTSERTLAAPAVVENTPLRTWLAEIEAASEMLGTLSAHRLLLSALILAAAYLLTIVLKRIVRHLVSERVPYSAGLRKLLPLVNLALWVGAVWIVLTLLLGKSPISVLVLVLISGVALAAASFHFLKDVVASVVIVFERPFKIGDRVKVVDKEGEVLHIGLRSFQISAPDGSITVIPNSDVLENSVTNTSHGAREEQVSVEIALPAGLDLNQAKRIATEAAYVSPFTFLKKPVEVEIDQSPQVDSALLIRIKAFVFDVEYASRLRSDLISLTRTGLNQAGTSNPPSVVPD